MAPSSPDGTPPAAILLTPLTTPPRGLAPVPHTPEPRVNVAMLSSPYGVLEKRNEGPIATKLAKKR